MKYGKSVLSLSSAELAIGEITVAGKFPVRAATGSAVTLVIGPRTPGIRVNKHYLHNHTHHI